MESNTKKSNIKSNNGIKRFLNIKSLIILLIAIMIMISVSMAVKHFINDDKEVKFRVLNDKEIPEKIKEILPRYQNLERALACKVNGEIFVVVTRGEKPTGGYTVEIDKIKKIDEGEDKFKLVVYAKFTDPKPGEVVTEAITYPYIITKTNLKELPYRIELKTRFED
ncbi:protease complex subunit PrcB family protein [Paramaledivibacter caminithermalis]|uniref:PrcB C-terminal n=1 Tax=Paramaledivibacter caminithermalis (strain DSM 15212 / CIP 107654 / DViRD3) TaxID=1121301 RepID=A0A1M6KSY3_PARC5|nr:protease complex subunit PrcB family protein [Paramaledivibacter caminithermalis]SHJ62068.1 PrcB C-terminal [Paramaledivibacter caminithermalis DSM 15212]